VAIALLEILFFALALFGKGKTDVESTGGQI
jgi:hypothetical protein